MKQSLIVMLLLFSLFTACQNAQESAAKVGAATTSIVEESNLAKPVASTVTTVTFDETQYQFGEVPKDIAVKHRFSFRNTGKADLVIESAKAACSCTVAEYSKEAVKPGEFGFVEAEFNAKAAGVFKKSVTVTANTDPRNIVLNFDGIVIE